MHISHGPNWGPEQITPRIWRVGGGSWNGAVPVMSAEGDANVYLLHGFGPPALIDCATLAGRPHIITNLRTIGVHPSQLRQLLLTHSHWDHTQAAADWQDAYDLHTMLNAAGTDYIDRGDLRLTGVALQGPDYEYEPFRVDHPILDGETFELSGVALTAHHLPGHTPDSTVFTFELAGRYIAFCGDVAFGRSEAGTWALGPLSSLWNSNLDDYVLSLKQLAQYPIDLLLPGHGAAVDGRDAVREAVAGTLATAEQLAQTHAVRQNTGT